MSGNYFLQFVGDDFQAFVIDKLARLVERIDFDKLAKRIKVKPEKLKEQVEMSCLERFVEDLRIAKLIPRMNHDGTWDARFSQDCLMEAGIMPAAADPNSSLEALDRTTQGNAEELNLVKTYLDTLVENHHREQSDLFDKLGIPVDGELWMTTYDNERNEMRRATCREFVAEIDSFSIREIKQYCEAVVETTSAAEAQQYGDSTRETIELCRKLVVGRTCVYASSKNDMMTEEGWKQWQRHAMILGSLAVYYVVLQMRRFQICGTYHLPSS